MSERGWDRGLLVAEALEQIDSGGPSAVSLRAIASRLEAPAHQLYRYVSGREELLEAVVAELVARIEAPLDADLTRTWQGYLQALANRTREVMREHPRAFPLVATRHPAAPWVRPPLRSLRLVDDFIERLVGFGFDDTRAVRTYQAFTSFLLGHLLFEATILGAQVGPAEVALDEGEADLPTRDGEASLRGFPHLVRLRPLLAQDTAGEQFEVGLESLLDRLELELLQ